MQNLLAHSEAQLRAACKERLETLEHWLRRLIDECLQPIYGDYFEYVDEGGTRLVKRQLAEAVRNRQASEPGRYPRKIDAVLLEDAIDIICKPELHAKHFRSPLAAAFPEGRDEARTFLLRLLAPRNHLAHSNPISVRQAEQVICYTNDVIDSLKTYYLQMGMETDYNVPLIFRFTDSFGNAFVRSQCQPHVGGLIVALNQNPIFALRPGDTLRVEIEVDQSFDNSTYDVVWRTMPAALSAPASGTSLVLPIEIRHVAENFYVECKVSGRRDWHRLGHGVDDMLTIVYRVLPPPR